MQCPKAHLTTFLPGDFLCRDCRSGQTDHQAMGCIGASIPVFIKSPHTLIHIHALTVIVLFTAFSQMILQPAVLKYGLTAPCCLHTSLPQDHSKIFNARADTPAQSACRLIANHMQNAPAGPVGPGEAEGVAHRNLKLLLSKINMHIVSLNPEGHLQLQQHIIRRLCIISAPPEHNAIKVWAVLTTTVMRNA